MIEPDVIVMRPFHEKWTGAEQEWHVYCALHPEFGFCGYEGAVAAEALYHGRTHEKTGQHPTPTTTGDRP